MDVLTLLEEYQILSGEDISDLDNNKQSLLMTLNLSTDRIIEIINKQSMLNILNTGLINWH